MNKKRVLIACMFSIFLFCFCFLSVGAQCGDGTCSIGSDFLTGETIYGSSDIWSCVEGVCLVGYQNGDWKPIYFVEAADVYCVGNGCAEQVFEVIRNYYNENEYGSSQWEDDFDNSQWETYDQGTWISPSEYSEFCEGNSWDCPDYISPITYPNGIWTGQSEENISYTGIDSSEYQLTGSSHGENELGYDYAIEKTIYGDITQGGAKRISSFPFPNDIYVYETYAKNPDSEYWESEMDAIYPTFRSKAGKTLRDWGYFYTTDDISASGLIRKLVNFYLEKYPSMKLIQPPKRKDFTLVTRILDFRVRHFSRQNFFNMLIIVYHEDDERLETISRNLGFRRITGLCFDLIGI